MAKYVIFDEEICTRNDLRAKNIPDNRMNSLTRIMSDHPDNEFSIEAGNDYLLIGERCYKYISSIHHLGLRKTNFYQVCDLPKISTSDGFNFTFVRKVNGTTKFDPRLKYFLSQEFNVTLRTLPEEEKIITKDLKVGIDWMNKYITGEWKDEKLPGWFGLDYETADVGEGHKDICGVGIASFSKGIFIDFRFPRSKSEWDEFSEVYIKFCKMFMDDTWVYNAKFEFDRTNETFNEYIDFCDAGAISIVDGRQKHYYSLKYTAQYYLSVPSWDDKFSSFANYLKDHIFSEYKSLDELMADKPRVERFKKHFIDEDDFLEWVEIAKGKPEYWGDKYYNQTSRNLGTYCITDSYNTLMIAATQWSNYPEWANRAITDNLRLGTQLMATGCYLSNSKRDNLRKINWKYQCYALFKLTSAMYTLKIRNVSEEFINRLSPTCKKLVLEGYNPTKGSDFWKDIAPLIVDEESESLLNEYDTERLLGRNLLERLIKFHARHKKPLTSFTRSKKMREDLRRYRYELFTETDREVIKANSSELRQITDNMVYERRLERMRECELWDMEFDEVDHNKEYMYDGNLMDLESIAKVFLNSRGNKHGWYKWASPEPQREAKEFFLNIMDGFPAAFTISMYDRVGSMRRILGKDTVKNPQEAYPLWLEYMASIEDPIIKDYHAKKIITSESFPEDYRKMQSTSNLARFYKNLSDYSKGEFEFTPRRKSLFTDGMHKTLKDAAHSGWGRWSKVESYPEIRNRTNKFGFTYDPTTPYEIITTTTKCFYMFSSYNKELQYIDGVFSNGRDRVTIDDKELRRTKDPEGDYIHIDTKFNMCRLKTKRSSSGFHTIPSSTAVKGIISAPKGYGMSYFDVSQAEPRLAAYLIDKDRMMKCYEEDLDLYYMTAAIMHEETYEEFLKRPDAKSFRSAFKTVLLGLLYGMGKETLAGRINTDVDTAQRYIDVLFDTFPKLRDGIKEFQSYPANNGRVCKTFWGDRLVSDSFDKGQMRRHGINYPVQGNTSIALSAGFYNVIRKGADLDLNIRPVLAVHDALINYFPIEQLWDLNDFYTYHFTDYLYEKCGVRFKFSVNYGTDYFNMAEITNLSDDEIEIDGSNYTIKSLMNELDSIGFLYEIVSSKREIAPIIDVNIRKYNATYGEVAVYDEDSTKNKVVLRRISSHPYNIPKYK